MIWFTEIKILWIHFKLVPICLQQNSILQFRKLWMFNYCCKICFTKMKNKFPSIFHQHFIFVWKIYFLFCFCSDSIYKMLNSIFFNPQLSWNFIMIFFCSTLRETILVLEGWKRTIFHFIFHKDFSSRKKNITHFLQTIKFPPAVKRNKRQPRKMEKKT